MPGSTPPSVLTYLRMSARHHPACWRYRYSSQIWADLPSGFVKPHFPLSPQEFLSDRDQGQSRLSAVVASGELVSVVAAKDRVEAVRVKVKTAREDWKNLMSNLHSREGGLQVSSHSHHSLAVAGCHWGEFCHSPVYVFQNLLTQMKDFEASAEPLQECLNVTELAVQESSTRLHDLTAKKMEHNKLQVKF